MEDPVTAALVEVSRAGAASDAKALVLLSKHESSDVRLAALKQMCPCRVKDSVEVLYDRIFGELGVRAPVWCTSQGPAGSDVTSVNQ